MAVRWLVPAFCLRQIVLTLNLLFILCSTLFWVVNNPKEMLFWFNFSLQYSSVTLFQLATYNNPIQNIWAKFNQTGRVCDIKQRSRLGLQPVVKVSASSRTIWKISGNQSPRRLRLYHIVNASYWGNTKKFCWVYYIM